MKLTTILHSKNFSGQLVAVVGAVGCGKSSLLSGLLGEERNRMMFLTCILCFTSYFLLERQFFSADFVSYQILFSSLVLYVFIRLNLFLIR